MPVDPVQLDQLFTEALARTAPDARAAFLDQACAENPELRERLVHLLAAHDAAGSFLKLPNEEVTTPFVALSERPGTVIGPYKLLQQIGEGGMGVVFMAEQTKPLQRMVALKIIKPGMDTRQVIARFESERQALAMMDHPNIAKVLDAGATDTGRPYFVMELVKGVPITQFCDDKQLPLRARLELLLPVCQAVQHAHQKGVIHRDIKPSNVLVANYDDQPIPKVIDFGVAKATASKLTEKTMFTEFGQIVGTLEYMSPEQATFNQLDIDTRSDIYSLGVLLYELLAGSTPFERKRLHAAAFDEVLRIIREEEPPKPSTRLSSSKTLPSIAANRHTEPARLSNDVRGELDWIVMKALEKNRNRRYETANGLAADVQRYLNDETVLACPPSAAYRFQKFARRNKPVLLTTGFIAATLILGTVISTWQALRASRAERVALTARAEESRQRELAETRRLEAEQQRIQAVANEKLALTEAARSQQVAAFLQSMLGGVGPSIALGRDTTLLREVLDNTAKQLDSALANQPDVEADLRATLGRVYRDLGEFGTAAGMFERALALRRRVHGPGHHSVASAQNSLAAVYRLQGRNSEAETNFREALAVQRRLYGDEHEEIANSLHGLAEIFRSNKATRANAEHLHRDALAMRRKLLGNESFEVARSLSALGVVLRNSDGRQSEAEAFFREALVIYRKVLEPDAPQLATTLGNLGYLLVSMPTQKGEGIEMLRESLAIQRKILGIHRGTAKTLTFLASAVNDPDEAELLYREALDMHQAVLDPNHKDITASYDRLIEALLARGKVAETLPLYRELLDRVAKKSGARDAAWTAAFVNLIRAANALNGEERAVAMESLRPEAIALADKVTKRGDIFLALAILGPFGDEDRVEAIANKLLATKPTPTAYELNEAAWALVTSPSPNPAISRLAVRLAEKAVSLSPLDSGLTNTLGWAYCQAEDFDMAVKTLRTSCDQAGFLYAFNGWYLTLACEGQGRKEEARRWFDASEAAVAIRGNGLVQEYARITSARKLGIPLKPISKVAKTNDAWIKLARLCVAADPKGRWAHVFAGRYFALDEDWANAVDAFSHAVELAPTNEEDSQSLAIALLKAGRESEYRQLCQAWLARLSDVQSFPSADKAAKCALLLPEDGTDFTRACELADFAATATEPSELLPWMHLGKALAEYRRERFDSAIEWADRCTSAKQVFPECAAAALFIQAAAGARLHQLESAQVAFGNGDKLVKQPRMNVELTWHDWAIADLLRAEAEELLTEKSASAGEKPLKLAATE